MFVYKKLDSEKYMLPVNERDQMLVERFQRDKRFSGAKTFGLCAAVALLTFLVCIGLIGNFDLVESIERTGRRLPFIGY